MQNHIPYGDYYSPNEYKENVSGSLISDENTKNSFAAYTKGIEYTDKAVKSLLNRLIKSTSQLPLYSMVTTTQQLLIRHN